LLFVFEAITTSQLVQTPDQVQAFDANVHAAFFVPAECEIFGFAFPLLITNGLIDFGNGILRILSYAPAVQYMETVIQAGKFPSAVVTNSDELNRRLHPRIFHLFSLKLVLDLTFESPFVFLTQKTPIPK
jgi:hypothetical protein